MVDRGSGAGGSCGDSVNSGDSSGGGGGGDVVEEMRWEMSSVEILFDLMPKMLRCLMPKL